MNRIMHGPRIHKRLCLLMTAALLTVFLGTPALAVRAEAGPADRRVPYMFFIDELFGKGSASGDERPYVDKNWTMRLGQKTVFSGWLAVEEGVARYEYAFVPQDDAFPEWKACEDVVISKRPDLARAGIPYPTGHDTAGFSLAVTAPESGDGYYDFYLRGVSGDDVYCDLLIVVNVAVGAPDTDDGRIRTVNLARLARDDANLTGGSFTDDDAAMLSGKGVLSLGWFDLGLFESAEIRYSTGADFVSKLNGDQAILGLKSAPGGSRAGSRPDPYTMDDGRYDMTDNAAYIAIDAGSGAVRLDLTEAAAVGELYLTAYLFGADQVRIESVSFVYAGGGADRVAVKVYFSGDLEPYFYSPNLLQVRNVRDDVMGDVLRFEVPEATNDTYIHFNFEGLLDTKGVKLSADDYKYMVILYRARKGNLGNHTTFYLCPGAIGGPTEACTKTFNASCDDKWHYLVLDLHTPDTWSGIIHLWRFDIIQGNANAGDYMDFATIQFFRTQEAAEKAASASLSGPADPYTCGGDPILLDMSEEEALAATHIDFAPAAERVYVFEEPATEPPTGAVTEPETEPASGTGTEPVTNEDVTDTPSGGCRSSLPALILLPAPAAPILFASRKKQYRTEN